MSMIKLVYRNEMRLLCRNPYLALPLAIQLICWGYVVYMYESQPVHYEEIAAVFYGNFQWILMVNLLVVGLFAVYMAGKDRESEFEYLAVTYKVKNTAWIAGKWLAAQTYGFGLTAMTLLVQGIWFLSGSMGAEERLQNLMYVFVQVEGAYFLLVSIGFLFGIWMKNTLSYICIPALLGAVFLLQANSYGFAYVNPRLNLATPYDSMYIATPYQSIWGINGVFDGAMLHQLAVFLLGVIVILAALLLFHPHRRLKIEKRISMTLPVILVIPAVVISGIRYSQYDSALEQYIETGEQYLFASREEEFAFLRTSTQGERPNYPFAIDRTDLNVLFPSDNRIEADSRLSIAYNGDVPVNDVSLTLHHRLAVTECSGSVEMTCSREKDFIRIRFPNGIQPNERFDLNLNYEGDMKQYRSDGLLAHSFIESGRVYLPKEAGWYPLIGERALAGSVRGMDPTYVQFELKNGGLVEDSPTAFTVTIKGQEDGVPMALTIPREPDGSYKGTSRYGLSLVGGNLQEVTVDQTRVVGHPEVLAGARKTTEMYLKYWDYIEEWLGVGMAPKVIYILGSDHSKMAQFTPSLEFAAWDFYDIKYADPSVMVYALATDLIHDNPSLGEDVHILQSAITWGLMKHFQLDKGFDRFGDWYAFDWRSQLPAEAANRIEMLNRFEENGGEQFLKAVNYVFSQYDGLKDKAEFNLETALKSYEGEAKR